MQSLTNECILPRRLVDLGFDPESLEISKQRLKKSEKIFQWKFWENCSAAGENIQENILRKFLMLIFSYLVFRFLNLIFASGMTINCSIYYEQSSSCDDDNKCLVPSSLERFFINFAISKWEGMNYRYELPRLQFLFSAWVGTERWP